MYIPVTFANTGTEELGLYRANGSGTNQLSFTAPNGQRILSPNLQNYGTDTGDSNFEFFAIKGTINVCSGTPFPTLLSTHSYPIECKTTTLQVAGAVSPYTHHGFVFQRNDGEIVSARGSSGTLSTTECMFVDTVRFRGTSQTITTGSVCETFYSSESPYSNVPTTASVTQGRIVDYYSYDTASRFEYWDKIDNYNLKSTGFTLEVWSDNISTNVGNIFYVDGSYVNNCEVNYVSVSQKQVTGSLFTYGRQQTGSLAIQTTDVLQNGIPHHHIVTYDTSSEQITYYRDGVLVGAGSTQELNNSLNRPYWYLDGEKFVIGEFRLYPFPLNQSQSLYNYNQTYERYEGHPYSAEYNVFFGNTNTSSCENTTSSSIYSAHSDTLVTGSIVYYDTDLTQPLTQSYFSNRDTIPNYVYFVSGSDGVITDIGTCTGSAVTSGPVVNVTSINTGSFYNTLFTGPSSLLNIPTSGVTLEIWAKNPSLTQGYDAFIGIWDGQSQPNRDWIEIRQNSSNEVYGQVYDQAGSNTFDTNPKTTVSDVNEFWHHTLTLASGSSDLLYYRNGQLEASRSAAYLQDSQNYQQVYVGQQEDGPVCNMYVGEYRIYTSSLDSSDILNNFNTTKTRYGY